MELLLDVGLSVLVVHIHRLDVVLEAVSIDVVVDDHLVFVVHVLSVRLKDALLLGHVVGCVRFLI